MRILHIEDQPFYLEMAKELFIDFDYHQATNGKEGFAKAISENWDLIIMDYQMPFMNGGEVTEAIRNFEQQHEVSKGVHIVANSNGYNHELIEAGANIIMPKHFSGDEGEDWLDYLKKFKEKKYVK